MVRRRPSRICGLVSCTDQRSCWRDCCGLFRWLRWYPLRSHYPRPRATQSVWRENNSSFGDPCHSKRKFDQLANRSGGKVQQKLSERGVSSGFRHWRKRSTDHRVNLHRRSKRVWNVWSWYRSRVCRRSSVWPRHSSTPSYPRRTGEINSSTNPDRRRGPGSNFWSWSTSFDQLWRDCHRKSYPLCRPSAYNSVDIRSWWENFYGGIGGTRHFSHGHLDSVESDWSRPIDGWNICDRHDRHSYPWTSNWSLLPRFVSWRRNVVSSRCRQHWRRPGTCTTVDEGN